jgi:hypothetical protein
MAKEPKAKSCIIRPDTTRFKPSVEINDELQVDKAYIGSGIIDVIAEVDIDGVGSDGRGYKLGFTQFRSTEKRHIYYRGRTADGGSLMLDLSQKDETRLCRDIRSRETYPFMKQLGSIAGWDDVRTKQRNIGKYPTAIDLTTERLPKMVNVEMMDGPSREFPLTVGNVTAKGGNLLTRFEEISHWCTLLILLKPDGSFDQLGHVIWHTSWSIKLVPPKYRVEDIEDNSTLKPDPVVIYEPVKDPRFVSFVAMPFTGTCNEVDASAASDTKPKESKSWDLLPNP